VSHEACMVVEWYCRVPLCPQGRALIVRLECLHRFTAVWEASQSAFEKMQKLVCYKVVLY